VSGWVFLDLREPSGTFGYAPNKRPLDLLIRYGVINLDKPRGPTSNYVVHVIKKVLNLKKAAHGGTLDPKVSGVLPILLEDSVKVLNLMNRFDKEYVCLMHLHKNVSANKLKNICKEFEGVIYQKPPVKSAVSRKIRKRKIYEIEVLEKEGRDVLLRVRCEAGTYIRKLVHDIGRALGINANMLELRRTRFGVFREEDSVTLQDVLKAVYLWKECENEEVLRKIILPVEKILSVVPKVVIKDTAVEAICHGANLSAKGIAQLETDVKANEQVAILTLKGELVALGKALVNAEEFKKSKGIVVDIEKVIMKPGLYPKCW